MLFGMGLNPIVSKIQNKIIVQEFDTVVRQRLREKQVEEDRAITEELL